MEIDINNFDEEEVFNLLITLSGDVETTFRVLSYSGWNTITTLAMNNASVEYGELLSKLEQEKFIRINKARNKFCVSKEGRKFLQALHDLSMIRMIAKTAKALGASKVKFL